MTLGEFRKLFPALESWSWLATAAVPPAAKPVADAVRAALDEWEDGSFAWQRWEVEAERTRDLFARLVGGETRCVALCSYVAEAAATVAATLPRGRIVVGEREFRSNLYPWLALRERGYELVTVGASTQELVAATRPGTVLVAVSAVQSATGLRVRLDELAAAARDVGARVFVDATQAVGVLRLDANAVDYVAVHGYKWLLSPRGAAWLHVREDRLDELRPLAPSWKTSARGDYYGVPYELAPDARRADSSLAWFSWAGARVALELVLSLDPLELEGHALALADAFRAGAALPLAAEQELPSQIVSVAVPDADALARRLRELRIVAAVRDGFLRVGFHGFNDERDVERALAALR